MNWPEYRSLMQDIETAKWQLFQTQFRASKPNFSELKSYYTGPKFWSEIAAYTLYLPRQTGKTTLISRWANELLFKDEHVIISAPSTIQLKMIENSILDKHGCRFLSQHDMFVGYSDAHLFIDESQSFTGENLQKALSYPWQSVTLVKG
jgi:predicted AAA+ superfamily ATPase